MQAAPHLQRLPGAGHRALLVGDCLGLVDCMVQPELFMRVRRRDEQFLDRIGGVGARRYRDGACEDLCGRSRGSLLQTTRRSLQGGLAPLRVRGLLGCRRGRRAPPGGAGKGECRPALSFPQEGVEEAIPIAIRCQGEPFPDLGHHARARCIVVVTLVVPGLLTI